MGYEDAKVETKKAMREADEKAKESWRKADGEESVSDHVANLGDDIRNELGPEFADFELTDLDPRRAMRKYIQDAWDETDDAEPARPGQLPLTEGELPPYDSDAT